MSSFYCCLLQFVNAFNSRIFSCLLMHSLHIVSVIDSFSFCKAGQFATYTFVVKLVSKMSLVTFLSLSVCFLHFHSSDCKCTASTLKKARQWATPTFILQLVSGLHLHSSACQYAASTFHLSLTMYSLSFYSLACQCHASTFRSEACQWSVSNFIPKLFREAPPISFISLSAGKLGSGLHLHSSACKYAASNFS